MIVQKVVEDGRIDELADVYIVNAENWLENVKFYKFDEIDELVEELSRYEQAWVRVVVILWFTSQIG